MFYWNEDGVMRIEFLLKKAIAEFIGTFAIVFIGCGAIMMHSISPESVSALGISLVFGLVVSSMIYALGHISGAHFNPAVTLAFAVVGHFPRKEILPYWTAQVLGGVAAVSVLLVTLPEAANYGATIPTLPVYSAFAWEAILTFFLMFVIIAVATDGRAVGIMAGAAIGSTVTMNALVAGALTGASMNPARSFAPALYSGTLEYFWLYMIAPCVGAILAAITYQAIRCEGEQNTKQAGGCC